MLRGRAGVGWGPPKEPREVSKKRMDAGWAEPFRGHPVHRVWQAGCQRVFGPRESRSEEAEAEPWPASAIVP